LVLGGIESPFSKDYRAIPTEIALCHAISDALLGALGKGDIGKHFPDTDDRWKELLVSLC